MSEDLEPLRLAAEELGLTTSEPVYYEVVVPTNKDTYWRFKIVACALDGTRELVWLKRYSYRWLGKRGAARHAKRLAREHKTGTTRVWVGG